MGKAFKKRRSIERVQDFIEARQKKEKVAIREAMRDKERAVLPQMGLNPVVAGTHFRGNETATIRDRLCMNITCEERRVLTCEHDLHLKWHFSQVPNNSTNCRFCRGMGREVCSCSIPKGFVWP